MRISGVFLKEKKINKISDEKIIIYPLLKKKDNERINEIVTVSINFNVKNIYYKFSVISLTYLFIYFLIIQKEEKNKLFLKEL